MKTKLGVLILLLAAAVVPAQTNNLTALLQQGLFEEQANRNLDAAIADYQALARQFDQDRQLAATAIFRLGECYRMQNKTNEAALEYQRILRDFPDQTTLAILSRQDLTGMGIDASPATPAVFGQTRTSSMEEEIEIQRIQTMIQNSPDLINAPSVGANGSLTPLENAASHGWLKVAAFLLDHGADVNARGGTALFNAVEAGNRAMVEFLLAHGANVNAINNSYKRTPLETAVQHGFEAVTAVLLANKADVNARDSQGSTPLFVAAQSGRTNIVHMLLTAGADVNAENNQGRTPLSFAADDGGPEIIKMLLDAKADPNAGRLDAPLLCAIHNQAAAAAKMLLEAGANPNAIGAVDWQPHSWNFHYEGPNGRGSATPLWLAVDMGQLSMVQLLLKFKADPNDTQIESESLLFDTLGNTNVLAALLDAGAKPDALDNIVNQRATPLEYAVRTGNAAAVEILLRHGADPNFSDVNGNTPLHYAAFSDRPTRNVFELLLDHHADPNVRNRDGKTPLDLIKDKEPPSQAGLGQVLNVTGSGGPPVLGAQLVLRPGSASFNPTTPGQAASAGQLADLLRQHGALDNLPDWNSIKVSPPSASFSDTVFRRGTNDWNHFTLLELLCQLNYTSPFPRFPFPDFAHIVIVRPNAAGAPPKRIEINLLDATNGVDCAKDVPLEFGDTVEIPEREHTLAERDDWTGQQIRNIISHLKDHAGEARLVVAGGATAELPLGGFEPVDCHIGRVLEGAAARNVLTSASDLSRVKVTRRDARTGKTSEWILDCRGGAPGLWLRDGDVITVPQK